MPNEKAGLARRVARPLFPQRRKRSHHQVTTLADGRVQVQLRIDAGRRTDHWPDLGGGLGYVPDAD